MEKRLIIAIDGYSSCGKSTFARMIARELNYIFIDSGAMYRAVTLYCIRRKFISGQGLNTRGILEELKDINIDFIYNPDINTHELGKCRGRDKEYGGNFICEQDKPDT